MGFVIDGLSLLILSLFIRSGWINGFKITFLRIIQVITAIFIGYLVGRYLGNWFSDWANRPRIISIPILGLFAASISCFIFHVYISSQIEKRQLHLGSCNKLITFTGRSGGIILSGLIAIIVISILFWSINLFFVIKTGVSLAGNEKSITADKVEYFIYQSVCRSVSTWKEAHHSVAIAKTISDPEGTVNSLKSILMASSVQQIISDPKIESDIMSGDINQLKTNISLNNLFNDAETMIGIRNLGIISGKETKESLYNKITKIGDKPVVRNAFINLKNRNLLDHKKLLELIRDPDFDIIISEFLKN